MDPMLHKAMVGPREKTSRLHLNSMAERFTPAGGAKIV
jgi:hypothetical protein